MWLWKTFKSKRGNSEWGRSCSQVKKHSSDYFTVAVNSSGDISAEPVRGQKIEEHAATDLDLPTDENIIVLYLVVWAENFMPGEKSTNTGKKAELIKMFEWT